MLLAVRFSGGRGQGKKENLGLGSGSPSIANTNAE